MSNLDTFNNIYIDDIQLHINFGGLLYAKSKLNWNIGIGFTKERNPYCIEFEWKLFLERLMYKFESIDNILILHLQQLCPYF